MLSRARNIISTRLPPGLKRIARFWKTNDSKVGLELGIHNVYDALLGRQPDLHELTHWKTFIGGRYKLNDVANSLMSSREYQQKAFAGKKALVEIQNFKLYVMHDDLDVGRPIADSLTYESHVTNALIDILKVGDVFLDLGANIGYFSLLAASIVQQPGKVISFEPNVQNLQLLYSSILANQFRNIQVYPLAASDSSAILKLTSFGSNGYLEQPPTGDSNCQLVQSVVLDELLKYERKLDAVKMDIEGYEIFALRGMRELIRTHRPVIFTEFSPWHIKYRCQVDPRDYLKELEKHGYSLSIIEFSGSITSVADSDALMSRWREFRNEQQHLDLIAHPL